MLVELRQLPGDLVDRRDGIGRLLIDVVRYLCEAVGRRIEGQRHLARRVEHTLPLHRIVRVDAQLRETVEEAVQAARDPIRCSRIEQGLDLIQVGGFLLGASKELLLVPNLLLDILRTAADQRPRHDAAGEARCGIEGERNQRTSGPAWRIPACWRW